jgi:hypothetical protein
MSPGFVTLNPGYAAVCGGRITDSAKSFESDLHHIGLALGLRRCGLFAPATRSTAMKKLTPYLMNGAPKLCFGCGEPFPIREGRIEALVGQDSRLYCYARTPECAALAMQPAALQSAA